MATHLHLVAQLAKRGMELVETPMANSPEMDRDDMMTLKQQELNDLFNMIPWWGVGLVILTGIALYVLNILVMYTINRVVMTLAMIETPTVDYIPIAALDNDSMNKASPALLIDGEAHTVVSNRPITSSIRGTIRHLAAHAGFFARWRGLGYCILYETAHLVTFYVLSDIVLSWLPARALFASVISAVLLARLHCAWTHKTIAVPSEKSFRSRFPPRSAWRQLWIPNAIASASATSATLLWVELLMISFGSSFNHEEQRIVDPLWAVVLKGAALIVVGGFFAFFIVLPNFAALCRIEATLLADDEDTIVPFDRTFGGKVTPVVVGGSGFRYVKEVCRTFDREARVRIIKLFFKSFLVSAALVVFTAHIISFEVFFIIYPIGKEMAKKAGAHAI